MTIDLQIDVAEVSREELIAALDAECHRFLHMSAEEFIATVRDGRELDDLPSAARLRVLAKALIDS